MQIFDNFCYFSDLNDGFLSNKWEFLKGCLLLNLSLHQTVDNVVTQVISGVPNKPSNFGLQCWTTKQLAKLTCSCGSVALAALVRHAEAVS